MKNSAIDKSDLSKMLRLKIARILDWVLFTCGVSSLIAFIVWNIISQ